MAGGGGEHQKDAGKLEKFGSGTWQGEGGPESVSEFLHCRDTAGPPLWGEDVGFYKEYRVRPGRLSGKGCKKVNREIASLWEVWAVVLPIPGGGDEGGGDRADLDINPPEAEHGCAIYCDAANS